MNSFTISSGHSLKVRGAAGFLDEVNEARKVTDKVAFYLKQLGCKVNTYHDNVSTSQNQNINNIVKQHNITSRELDISIHLNAHQTTNKAMGVEVLYVTESELSSKLSANIAKVSGLKDRGGKKRTNLGFLNGTHKPAILIETCFVDSKVDQEIYNDKFNEICKVIAETVSGRKLTTAPVSSATSTPITPSSTVYLKVGDRGDKVKELQDKLNKIGIDVGKADGIFGKNTANGVMILQRRKGLVVDGLVGDSTWKILNQLVSELAVKPVEKEQERIGEYRIVTGAFKDEASAKAASKEIGYNSFVQDLRVVTGTFQSFTSVNTAYNEILNNHGYNPTIKVIK